MKINMDTDNKMMKVCLKGADFDDRLKMAKRVNEMVEVGGAMAINEFRLSLPVDHPDSVYILDYLRKSDDMIHPVIESTDHETQMDTWVWRYFE